MLKDFKGYPYPQIYDPSNIVMPFSFTIITIVKWSVKFERLKSILGLNCHLYQPYLCPLPYDSCYFC